MFSADGSTLLREVFGFDTDREMFVEALAIAVVENTLYVLDNVDGDPEVIRFS